MSPVVRLHNVAFRYSGPLVLKNVDLEVARGDFLGLVGPNAGGKSTLLKIILGLLEPSQGSVSVLGKSPELARRELGYVPQFAEFPRDFPITVVETVLLGRMGRTRLLGPYRQRDRDIADRVMHETQILELKRRPIETLSGGQLQRVLMARALAAEPKILLLDEPTSNIDTRAEGDIFKLLNHLNQRMTIILVSHDIGFITRYVNRVACLNQTLMCHKPESIDGDFIQKLYDEPIRAVSYHAQINAGKG